FCCRVAVTTWLTVARSTTIVASAELAVPSMSTSAVVGSPAAVANVAPPIRPMIRSAVWAATSTSVRIRSRLAAWNVRKSTSVATISTRSARPRRSIGGGSPVALTVDDPARNPAFWSAAEITLEARIGAPNQARPARNAAASTRTNRQPRTSGAGRRDEAEPGQGGQGGRALVVGDRTVGPDDRLLMALAGEQDDVAGSGSLEGRLDRARTV